MPAVAELLDYVEVVLHYVKHLGAVVQLQDSLDMLLLHMLEPQVMPVEQVAAQVEHSVAAEAAALEDIQESVEMDKILHPLLQVHQDKAAVEEAVEPQAHHPGPLVEAV